MLYDVERVAELLGGASVFGARIESVSELEEAVEHGLPKSSLVSVVKNIYSDAKSQRLLIYGIVPEATYKRRDRLNRVASEKTERLARVLALADRVWDEKALARKFLTSPHALLGGRTPVEAAATDLGARQVEEILASIEYGLPV